MEITFSVVTVSAIFTDVITFILHLSVPRHNFLAVVIGHLSQIHTYHQGCGIYLHGGHSHAYHPCEESSRGHGEGTGSGGAESDVRPAHAHGLCQCQSARKQKVAYEPTSITVSNGVL